MAATVQWNASGDIERSLPVPNAQLLLWFLLATIAMLFAAFTSAYFIRRTGADWDPVTLPSLLWFNTAILVASSVVLEIGKRPGRSRQRALLWTSVLGIGFVVGQVAAWMIMVRQGILLPNQPHAAFFYIVSGLHGLHLLGGLVLLAVAIVSTRRKPGDNTIMNCFTTYWHFLAALWIGLLVLLALG